MARRVTHFIDSLGPGGAQAQLRHVVAGLDRSRWQPSVVWYDKRPPFRDLPADVAGAQLPRNKRLDPDFAHAVRGLLQPGSADVVHAWLQGPSLYAGLARLAGTVPLITSVRCSAAAFAADPMAGRMHLAGALLGDRTIVNCKDVIPWLTARGVPAHTIVHLPNMLPAQLAGPWTPPSSQKVAACLADFGLTPDQRPIVLLGRFDRYKNQDGLVRALAIVKSQGNPVPPLVLCGDVEDAWRVKEVQDLAHHHRLDVRIFPAYGDAQTLQHAARLVVLCSHSEGSPNVVLESLAVGGLVVAVRVGEVADLVVNGVTGLTCNPGDDFSLATRVAHALALHPNAVQAMRSAAVEDVRARFAPDVLLGRLADVYDDVLAAHRPVWQRKLGRPLMAGPAA